MVEELAFADWAKGLEGTCMRKMRKKLMNSCFKIQDKDKDKLKKSEVSKNDCAIFEIIKNSLLESKKP